VAGEVLSRGLDVPADLFADFFHAGELLLAAEAMQELGLKVGKLVRQLAKTTEARRAERELEIIDQEPEDEEFESADDPGLQWEEITDDDE